MAGAPELAALDVEEWARWEADVVLSDGGTVHVRPIRPDDAPRIVSLGERLSKESRDLRFFSPMPRLPRTLLEHFVNVDYDDRMALVALLGDDIVGVARYDALPDDRSQAEVAFTVDDAHQGRGVGTVLLEHLAAFAADRGLTRFVADTLPNNNKMLGVFRSAGFADQRVYADGLIRVMFPIEPTPASIEAVRERERHSAAASVERLLRPRSVAVIGASRRPLAIGHEVFANLLRSGFSGPVYPVNPSAASVASVRAYPTVTDIPDEVDLAVVVVPAAQVPEVVAACGAKGVRALVVMSEGFADAGPEGAAAQRALVTEAHSFGMRLLGPNCMGVANTHPDVSLNATLVCDLPPRGRVGFMAQSGPLGVAVLEEMRRRGVGVSSFVSAGNKADLSSNDVLQYWDDDADTDVVLLYLESFGNPRTFARIARRLSARKPIVAVKGARSASGQAIAGTPWRVPAGSDEIIGALFLHTGVVRVDTLAELYDVAEVLAHQPLPAGRRIGIVANAGGSGALVADACEAAGLVIPTLSDATCDALRDLLGGRAAVTNPVTVAGVADADAYESAVSLVLADDVVDAVIVSFLTPLATTPASVATAVSRAIGRRPGKPLIANFMAADDAARRFRAADPPIPVFAYPEAAAQALASVVGLVEWRARPAEDPPAFADVDVTAARLIVSTALIERPGGTELDLATVLDLLATYRVPVVATRAVGTADEAMDAAASVGFPVAVTSASTGASMPDLHSPADVARAWSVVAPSGGAVVSAMAPPGVATVIEVVSHPTLGPLLSFGTAGPVGEIFGDRALRVLPLTPTEADELIRSVRGAALLLGYQGQPPTDLAALAELMLRVSQLVQDIPEIAAVVLDPVVVSADGAVASRAQITVAPYHPRPELALRRLV